MSILLDALKRSESQRDLGSVPTLQTSLDANDARSESQSPLVYGGMLLLAAGIISWLLWQQFRLPDSFTDGHGLAQKEVMAQSDDSAEMHAEQSTANADDSEKGTKNLLPVLADSSGQQIDESSAVANEREDAKRRVGQEFRSYEADAPQPAKAPVAAAPTRDNAIRERDLASVELSSPADTVSEPANESFMPEAISYWQVPESKRAGLPDLRISVLVYAEQPENRFLLLNGERMREGEELENGLFLEEIQRDKAIFVYKNYRFHLKS